MGTIGGIASAGTKISGTTISGIGHAALIGWVLIGGVFMRPTPSEIETVADVALISADQFFALQSEAPKTVVETPEVQSPTSEAAPNVAAPADTPVEPKDRPAPTPEPKVEAPPEKPEIAPPKAEAVVESPPAPEPPATDEVAVIKPEEAAQKPADRVAPVPSALSQPDAIDDVITREATIVAPSDTPVEPIEEATAPEEAATEIVTEAEEIKTAPVRSIRPKSRPKRAEAVAEVEPKPETPAVDPLQAALSEALSEPDTQADTPAPVPSGPPLTGSEKEGLKVSVSNCWNVGSLSTDALQVTVTIGFSVKRDTRPENGSIHLVSATGGSESSINKAYEAGRRAIIRCGSKGFPLPDDKYEQWRDIEITFNPERMRIK